MFVLPVSTKVVIAVSKILTPKRFLSTVSTKEIIEFILFPTKILQISLIVAYSLAKEICSKVPEIRDLHKKHAVLKGVFAFS